MTGADLKSALADLSIRPLEFAALCGAERSTAYRWMRDTGDCLPVPGYAATIVRLARGVSIDTLLAEIHAADAA